jgi:hypothetical protein
LKLRNGTMDPESHYLRARAATDRLEPESPEDVLGYALVCAILALAEATAKAAGFRSTVRGWASLTEES